MKNLFTTASLRLRFRAGRNPARDWAILLALSGVVLVGIIAWNAWAFNAVANGGVIGSAPSRPAVFNRASIDTVTAIFAERAAEEEKYQTGVYRFTDPSQ